MLVDYGCQNKLLFIFSFGGRLNSGLYTCKADAVLLEPSVLLSYFGDGVLQTICSGCLKPQSSQFHLPK
jgi:hypothetical protein